jgi:hypothetical protein
MWGILIIPVLINFVVLCCDKACSGSGFLSAGTNDRLRPPPPPPTPPSSGRKIVDNNDTRGGEEGGCLLFKCTISVHDYVSTVPKHRVIKNHRT